MNKEFKWLSKEAVLAIHARQRAEHGGPTGVRDEGLLESALQRPHSKLAHGEPEIADLAGAYAFNIARNHPFVDGNERTALVFARAFLLYNGWQITAAPEARLRTILALAYGELAEDALAAWFRKHLKQVG